MDLKPLLHRIFDDNANISYSQLAARINKICQTKADLALFFNVGSSSLTVVDSALSEIDSA